MQYHLNGFRSGDPALAPSTSLSRSSTNASEVDVLIVGCGPAGLTLGAQLSVFDDVSFRIMERKDGPLEFGQADGIACRSVEMFEAFGFADKVIKEAYWVNEVSFWRPGADGKPLARADRIQDVEDDLSEMPHVILSQARIHDFLLEYMHNSPARVSPDYNREFLTLDQQAASKFPLRATFKCLDTENKTEAINARFLVGCDGARSAVRASMGYELKGESARQLWGVMDVLPQTTFPDIRLKCAIQSADAGSLLIIPREGGYMVRLYIELDELTEGERAADRQVSADELIAKAKKIFQPYSFDAAEVAWWSAYEIGQGVCDAFDDVSHKEPGELETPGEQTPHIFIAGDACHTHSPKAGQGMNVSMADAFNLGWKLAAVVRGQAPSCLLNTYSAERRAKAKELIDFDRDMARLFSEKPKSAADAEQFQQYFKKHGRYTAGVETRYSASIITGDASHQHLAAGLTIGKRFHSAPVTRVADAKPMQLGHVLKADGRWRLIAFAPHGDDGVKGGPIARLCETLYLPDGLIRGVTGADADIDSVIDLRAVFQQSHQDINIELLPALLLPAKGCFSLTDYEKVFCPAVSGPDLFDIRGIDRKRGALLLVRPDQFVALVLPLEAVNDLSEFVSRILTPKAVRKK
ncbi:MAG: FAD-dependent monooxygenase [Granulosicoccus sp.]|nr:FAD-dependent monooxygenase [Granulosicoccus sp.]